MIPDPTDLASVARCLTATWQQSKRSAEENARLPRPRSRGRNRGRVALISVSFTVAENGSSSARPTDGGRLLVAVRHSTGRKVGGETGGQLVPGGNPNRFVYNTQGRCSRLRCREAFGQTVRSVQLQNLCFGLVGVRLVFNATDRSRASAPRDA